MSKISAMKISSVEKVNQKRLHMRLEEVKDQVKSVLLDSIQSYIGREGNISLPNAAVHTFSLHFCCVLVPVLHVREPRWTLMIALTVTHPFGLVTTLFIIPHLPTLGLLISTMLHGRRYQLLAQIKIQTEPIKNRRMTSSSVIVLKFSMSCRTWRNSRSVIGL